MKLLIIGGTRFLGRAVAAEALARGHEVTTFNRGRTGSDLPGVEAVRGDRESPADLARLAAGRSWDAVVDTCGYVPRVVGRSARALSGHAGTYAFISSVSAIDGFPGEPAAEGAPGFACEPDAGPDDGDYGVLKAGCERAVTAGFSGNALVVRPGLILGPHEDVGRLPWWLTRISRGGRVLAPGDPQTPMQLVDVRDVAIFTLDQAERGASGTFVATGPAGNTTYGEWLRLCREATGSGAELVWVDSAFLVEQGAGTFVELPLWGGPPSAETGHFWSVPTAEAEAAGLRTRPVAETVRDTWAWLREVPEERRSYGVKMRHGMAPEKEAAILAAWDSRS
ncbi:NAD-dependent epimerase/dehydratase family protein [Nonomuraea phyllanthi]|uniref:NAD-dependent epimerase/dehydratase family protein n=1 Tax=Nonomuraea phyllanthi TaxID=2219224 RepID=A0A5C4W6W9_9ACTN|nr:NAD-dependent epimerase/dehydratase family protein [Nonomuraea phyllanthi]KAB8192141.1 NAD-dependent epimerase/dehydratase family protein [Nonomuraea phyllanthi]QFY11507.1 NAD-dependent epimerase/dehydratase family protein [Nonomuraea phyllanthi]